jgi:hypothetical protein
MSDADVFRTARMALAAVIERLPHGDPLGRQCSDLVGALRDHEYTWSEPALSHQTD